MTRKGVPSPLQLLLECGTKGVLPTQKKEEEKGKRLLFIFLILLMGIEKKKECPFSISSLSPVTFPGFFLKKIATVCFGAYRTNERVKKTVGDLVDQSRYIIISLDVYGKTATVAACDLFRRKEEEEGKVRLTAAARSQSLSAALGI